MNYQQIYDDLCAGKGKNRNLTGKTHKHHIIPRCISGTDDPNNLVILTLREHFIAHRLLTKIYPNHSGLIYAVFNMSKCYHYSKINSRTYEYLQQQYSKSASELATENWKNPKFRSKQLKSRKKTWQDPNIRAKQSKIINDPEFKKKQSLVMKKHWQQPEYQIKMSKIRKELWQNSKLRQKQSETIKEVWKNPEHQDKMSAAQSGKQWVTNGIKTKRISKRDPIPNGWHKGRKLKIPTTL